jgi:endonuclease/exonuclease/phosphatase family metal-dependent hydrolase
MQPMKSLLATLLVFFSITTKASLTVGTYNIRNFDYDQRYRIRTNLPALTNILQNIKTDLLAIEEINNVAEFTNYVSSKMPGYKVRLSECGGAHGQRLGFVYNAAKLQMLSFNEELSLSIGGGCNSGSRPLAIALFEIKQTKQKFFGMAAHLKSGSRPDSFETRSLQYKIISEIIADLKTKTGVSEFFLAGDLNSTEYRNRGKDFHMLNRFATHNKMKLITQSLPCSAYWWGGSDDGVEEPSLLDHILVTPGLMKLHPNTQVFGHCAKVSCSSAREQDLGVSFQEVSDHCPVTARIQ